MDVFHPYSQRTTYSFFKRSRLIIRGPVIAVTVVDVATTNKDRCRLASQNFMSIVKKV